MRILLGVSGGIAAYKAVLLLRLLREQGHAVRVIPTRAALEFVGAPTFEALSGEPVSTEVFDDVPGVQHVALGKGADLVIVAPATADLMARAVAGLADDLLTTTLLVARCPVVLAPAMHTEMWDHPATRSNVATLRERGVHVIEPASGRLTGQDTGPGRLPEPEDIAREALSLVSSSPADPSVVEQSVVEPAVTLPEALPGTPDLTGRRVVVSAGGTREPIVPVRFIGNRSSGRQGVALAQAAAARGAEVTLVAANLAADVTEQVLAGPRPCSVVQVESTAELRAAVRAAGADADVVVMAAAVADFRPASTPDAKIKKVPGQGPAPIELTENPDILAELAHDRLRTGQVVVGFAAETGDAAGSVLEHGRAKALRKGADLIAVNAVGSGRGFGTDSNEVTLLDGAGDVVGQASGSKREVADALWDAVAKLLS